MALTSPRFAKILAGLLQGRNLSEPPDPPAADRAEAIALIAGAMDRKKRATRRIRWAIGTVSAAALFFAGVGVSHLIGRGAPLATTRIARGAPVSSAVTVIAYAGTPMASSAPDDIQEPTRAGKPLTVGSTYKTDSTGATLALSTGTRIAVEPASEITVVDEGRSEVFALSAGSMKANVAKLDSNERFIVRTPDAEVEVRGTSFRVSVVPSDPNCGHGTRTRVRVYEGVVVVRREGTEESLSKGEQWPAGCPKVPPSVLIAPPDTGGAAAAPRSVSMDLSPSNLGEQNDLFAEAMRAKRNGDGAAAVSGFDRLVARYPSGQLAENAAAERMKVLATIDRRQAVAAANQYLARYPSGFARGAAEAILHEAH